SECITARNVVWAEAGGAAATAKLPMQAAARIAFLNASISFTSVAAAMPKPFVFGRYSVCQGTIGSIFRFTTSFDQRCLKPGPDGIDPAPPGPARTGACSWRSKSSSTTPAQQIHNQE